MEWQFQKEDGETEDDKRKRVDPEDDADDVYIGETGRSAMERGLEHSKDLEYYRSKSHMLKHIVDKHEDIDPELVEFRMKVIIQHKTAFERQISEAVQIRRNAGPFLLNSKLEYNRCFIPKIVVKRDEKPEKADEKSVREVDLVKKIHQLEPRQTLRNWI